VNFRLSSQFDSTNHVKNILIGKNKILIIFSGAMPAGVVLTALSVKNAPTVKMVDASASPLNATAMMVTMDQPVRIPCARRDAILLM
jgi:hypothetical protein